MGKPESVKNWLSVLDNSGTLSKTDKDKIRKLYFDTFGRELRTQAKCTNCWHDALIELYSRLNKGTLRLYNGVVIEHKGRLIHTGNITEADVPELYELYKDKFYELR